ncbi:MAG: hypothetical protein Q7V05_16470 [Methanoregula sp.]|nr:hypothetical protein [Methanoregula sp.]
MPGDAGEKEEIFIRLLQRILRPLAFGDVIEKEGEWRDCPGIGWGCLSRSLISGIHPV